MLTSSPSIQPLGLCVLLCSVIVAFGVYVVFFFELVAFYCRVGIVFSGRQAPGGHNVIWGLYEALKVHNAKNTLLGFLGMLCFLISVKNLLSWLISIII